MILITTQCFPPDRGGIEMLMGGLADALHACGRERFASCRSRPHGRAADTSDVPYAVRRFGGFKSAAAADEGVAVAEARAGAAA